MGTTPKLRNDDAQAVTSSEGAGGLQITRGAELQAQDSATRTGLPAHRLIRHAAALIDAMLDAIYSGQPIGITGRKVLTDLADRLRYLAEVLR
jgi:hypothetical protein